MDGSKSGIKTRIRIGEKIRINPDPDPKHWFKQKVDILYGTGSLLYMPANWWVGGTKYLVEPVNCYGITYASLPPLTSTDVQPVAPPLNPSPTNYSHL